MPLVTPNPSPCLNSSSPSTTSYWRPLKAFAQRRGQQLDALVAEWLQATVQPAAAEPLVRPSLAAIQQLAGSLKASADFDYKRELEEGLAEKYGV
ncbi:MAG: hypothetical protein WKG07_43840 [Hymenobacter sp.]